MLHGIVVSKPHKRSLLVAANTLIVTSVSVCV